VTAAPNRQHHNGIVAIVGTNASGKSELAVSLAESFDGEVVSADSRQVYRRLDIGTGKLDERERRGIPHHLIDVAEVTETRFSLADFQRLAYTAIDSILRRDRLPLLVGGTGLYVRAIVEGYQLVAAVPDLRRRAELEAMEIADLHRLFTQYNPSAAATIDPRNKRRVIRAIEIEEQGIKYPDNPSRSPRYRALQLGLTWPPEVLRQRITVRLQRRVEAGMIKEVEDLIAAGVPMEILDSLGLEYRHISRFLTGGYGSEEEFLEKLETAIYRFSRRQLSWFRKDESIVWLDTSQDYVSEARKLVAGFITG
jgi:tRNA dimethylallyltransferase